MFEVLAAQVAKKEYEERVRRGELNYRLSHSQGQQASSLDASLLALSRLLVEAGERLRQRLEMRLGLN